MNDVDRRATSEGTSSHGTRTSEGVGNDGESRYVVISSMLICVMVIFDNRFSS